MHPPRKGERLTIGGALLLLYALMVMEAGRGVLSRATTVLTAPLVLEPRATGRGRRLLKGKQRRILAGNRGVPTVDDERGGNDFLEHFERILADNATIATNEASAASFAALILRENRVYCRKSQMEHLSRARYFVQMLRRGLQQTSLPGEYSSLPIIVKHDDSNGCHPARGDRYGFPRLAWSIPANATAQLQWDPSLCRAVGMPSYKMWRALSKQKRTLDQETTMGGRYPWRRKVNKAVWRGSTTANRALYGHLPPQDIPRAKLVQASLKRPNLIDAGFHKLTGRYDDEALRNMVKKAVPLEVMAWYKAVIDIDGNGWSARFPALLCTDSVVVKIAPDFVEPFYAELQPNVHYVPASLENLTQVVEYALDENNDKEMRGIVARANEWCRDNNTVERLTSRAVDALEAYAKALDEYDGEWQDRWKRRSEIAWKRAEDWAECRM